MIPTTQQRQVIQLGQFPETEMQIAKGQEQWIIYMLRNGMYKFKVRSPIREYLVNAQDEHRKFKVSRPIEVTLPSPADSSFRVRDFGAGLLPDVRNEAGDLVGGVNYYFGQYGASDKRETNEEAGFMGIGAKSAFAYSKEFTVVSYKNKIKYTTLIFIDENNKGKTALLDESKTDEPDGVELVIPVNPADRNEFHSEALDLMKHFKVKPVIHGTERPHVWEEPEEPLLKGESWRVYGNYYKDEDTSVAIMGEIAYPIRAKDIKGLSKWETDLLNAGLELDFAIGEIHMTTNREELELDSITLEAIRARLRDIRQVITQTGKDSFSKCKTLIEAKTLFYALIMTGQTKSVMKELISEVEWNGYNISDNVINLSGAATLITYSVKKQTIRRTSQETNLKCTSDMKLYVDDTEGKEIMYRRRANTVLANSGVNRVEILQVRNRSALQQLGIDPDSLESYNAVSPTKLNSAKGAIGRIYTGTDLSKRAKHTKKVFKLKLGTTYYRDAASDNWEVATIDNSTEGLFVPLVRFQPQGKFFGTTSHEKGKILVSLLGKLRKLNVTIPDIYGVKSSDKNTFDEWFETTVNNLPDEDIALRIEFNSVCTYYNDNCPSLNFSVEELPDGHLVKTYHDIRERATKIDKDLIQVKSILFERVGRKIKSSEQIKCAYNAMIKRYPVLRWVEGYYSEARARDLLDYITDVDLLEAKRKK